MGEPVIERLRRAGQDLYAAGLVSTRGGNLSARIGDTIVITRAGAELAHVGAHDLVEVPVAGPGERDQDASSDLEIHREIYQRTPARAVAHAHPTNAVVLAFGADSIEPVDHEGRVFLPRVPVVEERKPRSLVAHDTASALADGRIVVVRTHGTYACGDSIEAASHWTTALELSARILLGLRHQS